MLEPTRETNQMTQDSTPSATAKADIQDSFEIGSDVIYGLQGRCVIVGRESKVVGTESIEFFKLQTQKAQLSRSKKVEPYIWAPVHQAKKQGLRKPLSPDQVEGVQAVLTSHDIYFDVDQPWRITLKILEKAIAEEGVIGLAKVVSFFEGFKIKNPIPDQEIGRMDQLTFRLLTRELSECTGQSIKSQEERVMKAMKHKELP